MIFTLHNIENLAASLRGAGARGCVLKSEPMTHLIEAVQSAAHHRPYFAAAMSARSNGSPLTDREREIVQLIADRASTIDWAL